MDIEHWIKLYKIDYTIIYLAPKEKWDEIIKSRTFLREELEGTHSVYEDDEPSLFTNMTKQAILEQLYPKAQELLKDPIYDLK